MKHPELYKHITEKQFQSQLIRTACMLNWTVYHTHDSRKSAPGFPDLVMLGHGRQIVAELKTEKGRVSPYQTGWLDAFREVTQPPEVFLWRPSDIDEVIHTLQNQASPSGSSGLS